MKSHFRQLIKQNFLARYIFEAWCLDSQMCMPTNLMFAAFLVSQLSSLLGDAGLNIREAHVYSTSDGYSLDVFIVDGWHVQVCNITWKLLFLSKLAPYDV